MPNISTQGKDRGNALVQFYRWVFGIGYERNIGGIERTIRYSLGALFAVIGIGLVVLPVFRDVVLTGLLAVILIVGGLYLIYEAQVQYCPLNHTFDRSTYSRQ